MFKCPVCNAENFLSDCFRDRAVEYELRNSTLKCLDPSCPWERESRFYQVCILSESPLIPRLYQILIFAANGESFKIQLASVAGSDIVLFNHAQFVFNYNVQVV